MAPRLGVCVRDVDEASPLDHYIHAEVTVGVEGRSAFHLMVDGKPLEGAGLRAY